LASHRSVRDRRTARHPAGGAGRRRPGAGSAEGRPSERATGGTGWTALVPMLRSQEAPTLHKHPEVAVAAGLAPILVVSRCRCHRTRARPVGHHTKRSSKRKKGESPHWSLQCAPTYSDVPRLNLYVGANSSGPSAHPSNARPCAPAMPACLAHGGKDVCEDTQAKVATTLDTHRHATTCTQGMRLGPLKSAASGLGDTPSTAIAPPHRTECLVATQEPGVRERFQRPASVHALQARRRPGSGDRAGPAGECARARRPPPAPAGRPRARARAPGAPQAAAVSAAPARQQGERRASPERQRTHASRRAPVHARRAASVPRRCQRVAGLARRGPRHKKCASAWRGCAC